MFDKVPRRPRLTIRDATEPEKEIPEEILEGIARRMEKVLRVASSLSVYDDIYTTGPSPQSHESIIERWEEKLPFSTMGMHILPLETDGPLYKVYLVLSFGAISDGQRNQIGGYLGGRHGKRALYTASTGTIVQLHSGAAERSIHRIFGQCTDPDDDVSCIPPQQEDHAVTETESPQEDDDQSSAAAVAERLELYLSDVQSERPRGSTRWFREDPKRLAYAFYAIWELNCMATIRGAEPLPAADCIINFFGWREEVENDSILNADMRRCLSSFVQGAVLRQGYFVTSGKKDGKTSILDPQRKAQEHIRQHLLVWIELVCAMDYMPATDYSESRLS